MPGHQSSDEALSLDLLRVYDDFIELKSSYFFLLEAVTALMMVNNDFDRVAVDGISSLADQIKGRSEVLCEELKAVHDRFHTKAIKRERAAPPASE